MGRSTKGLGKHGGKHTHTTCPRCGAASLHARKKECAKCGYGKSKKIKKK